MPQGAIPLLKSASVSPALWREKSALREAVETPCIVAIGLAAAIVRPAFTQSGFRRVSGPGGPIKFTTPAKENCAHDHTRLRTGRGRRQPGGALSAAAFCAHFCHHVFPHSAAPGEAGQAAPGDGKEC